MSRDMSKTKTVLAGLGAMVCLGAAIAPLTSCSADGQTVTGSGSIGDSTVNVSGVTVFTFKLESTISMTLTSTSTVGSTGSKTIYSDGTSSGTDQVVATNVQPGTVNLDSMQTSAKVSVNTTGGYTLTITDSDNDNSLRISGTNNTIPADDVEPTSTTSSWAIYNPREVSGSAIGWVAVPVSGTYVTLRNTDDDGNVDPTIYDQDETIVKYGVGASSDQLHGTYTDTVVYTATALP